MEEPIKKHEQPLAHQSVENAKSYIQREWMKKRKAKAEKIGQECTKRLNEYLDSYFNSFSQADPEKNEFAYNVYNKEWKAYCYKVNATQNSIVLKFDHFETEVALIVSKNPQFQTK